MQAPFDTVTRSASKKTRGRAWLRLVCWLLVNAVTETRRSNVEVTPMTAEEWPLFRYMDELAFGYTWPGTDDDPALGVMEHERSIIARHDGEPAGIASAFSFHMTVPGGSTLPTAGVTWVGVLPTHRRRGVLTELMKHQLMSIAQACKEPLAALWASEPGIYGRFGYGLASRKLDLNVPKSHSHLVSAPVDDGLNVHLEEPSEALADMKKVFDAARRNRPGWLTTSDARWAATVHDPPDRREGASALRAAVVTDRDGLAKGFTLFATKPAWTDRLPTGEVQIRLLVAEEPSARAALWRFLLGIDLMSKVSWWNAPTDEPLLHLLVNPRAAHATVSDQLYVRVVDLARALTSRAYSSGLEIVLEVTDQLLTGNEGRWRLSVADDGRARSCVRTADPLDISLDIRELGAAYLGSTSLRPLADAGLVSEHTPGSIDRATTAFGAPRAAWCPFMF